MVERMQKLDQPPDKGTDQMGWGRHMNSLHMVAESTVIREVVFE
jgi:hypothetical protein